MNATIINMVCLISPGIFHLNRAPDRAQVGSPPTDISGVERAGLAVPGGRSGLPPQFESRATLHTQRNDSALRAMSRYTMSDGLIDMVRADMVMCEHRVLIERITPGANEH